MWQKRLTIALCFSLGVLTLFGLALTRKPLCINSRIVERIDRIDREGTESLWRCNLAPKEGTYLPHLSRLLPSLSDRIDRIEDRLWKIERFRYAIRIVILVHRPWAFRLQGNTLYMGEKMLEAEGHLERGVIKAWLRERNESFIEGDLPEEVTADLLQDVMTGGLALSGTGIDLQTKSGEQWPQVLKDSKAYCESPWKLSEHYEVCRKEPERLKFRAWTLSLRPLLSSAMLAAWDGQSLKTRLQSLHELPLWIGARGKNEPVIEGDDAGLLGAAKSVQSFMQLLAERSSEGGGSATASLFASFANRLRVAGFKDTKASVNLDFLILSERELKDNAELLQSLTSFAESRPTLKIAIKDPKHLWLLPTGNVLPVEDMAGLTADRLAILRCDRFDFEWVFSFETRAKKLFVIDSCKGALPDLRPWIMNGAEGFARANIDSKFIQFDLPSLASRKGELDMHADVREMIEKRDITDPIFQMLGWQELRWLRNIQAYQPRANIDAIEWFRTN